MGALPKPYRFDKAAREYKQITRCHAGSQLRMEIAIAKCFLVVESFYDDYELKNLTCTILKRFECARIYSNCDNTHVVAGNDLLRQKENKKDSERIRKNHKSFSREKFMQ